MYGAPILTPTVVCQYITSQLGEARGPHGSNIKTIVISVAPREHENNNDDYDHSSERLDPYRFMVFLLSFERRKTHNYLKRKEKE
jgi:hypothetical protein